VLEGELEANYDRIEASMENGVASRYDLDSVQVERLNARQRRTELNAALRSGKESLAALIGEELGDNTVLATPEAALPERVNAGGARPELALFEAQGKACDSQEDMARAAAMPKLSAFLQAAYGQPGLDMFQGGFSPYWIGGLKLSWSVNALVDLKDQIGKIESARESIEAQRRAFILDNGIQAARAKSDVGKLRELLASDDEIIALREGMRKSVEGKRDNGAATTDDVLKAIDAESLARQMKSLHEVQLAMAAYAYKYAVNE
jgi:outer membrane protein TolC